MSNKKKLGEITITLYETDDSYKTKTRFSNDICVNIFGVRALVKTLHILEQNIAKQVFSSDEDDDLLKSILLDN